MQASRGRKRTFNHPCYAILEKRDGVFFLQDIHYPQSTKYMQLSDRGLDSACVARTYYLVSTLQKVRMVFNGFEEFSTELSWKPPTYLFCKIKTSFWKKRGKNKTYEERKEKGNDKNNAPSDRAKPSWNMLVKCLRSLSLCNLWYRLLNVSTF